MTKNQWRCIIHSYPSRLAQSLEHETLNLGVVGSSPTLGVLLFTVIITKCYSDNGSQMSVCLIFMITLKQVRMFEQVNICGFQNRPKQIS